MTFRMHSPTLVLAVRNNRRVPVTVQAGKIVDVLGVADDDRFVIVSVDGEEFQMFATDLEDRGEASPSGSKRVADS